MVSKHNLLRVAAALAVLVILAGCRGEALPTLVPTVDIQVTLGAVATQAAKTVVANITQSAPTETAVPPTATLAPTDTEAPTITPLPSFTPPPPTATFVPWTATPLYTATSSVTYYCKVTAQSPKFADKFPKGASFDGNWTVENTSSTTWGHSEVDFKYISGTKFQEKVDLVDLTADVAKDATYNVIIDMLAPKTVGRYSATWAFVQGSNILCPVYLTIDVK